MTRQEVPLGLDGRSLVALFASAIAASAVAIVFGMPWVAPIAAAGVVFGLGGGLLWGQVRLRRKVAYRLAAWGNAVEDVHLTDGGFVPRWEVRLDDGNHVAFVGTAFGPRNPLFLEDDDGMRRL